MKCGLPYGKQLFVFPASTVTERLYYPTNVPIFTHRNDDA